MLNNSINENKHDIQYDPAIEYNALTSYCNQLVVIRFTIFGLFLTALVSLYVFNLCRMSGFIGFILSISLLLIELRNKSILNSLNNRGSYIEREYWKLDQDEGFYSIQIKNRSNKFDGFVSHFWILTSIYIIAMIFSFCISFFF